MACFDLGGTEAQAAAAAVAAAAAAAGTPGDSGEIQVYPRPCWILQGFFFYAGRIGARARGSEGILDVAADRKGEAAASIDSGMSRTFPLSPSPQAGGGVTGPKLADVTM